MGGDVLERAASAARAFLEALATASASPVLVALGTRTLGRGLWVAVSDRRLSMAPVFTAVRVRTWAGDVGDASDSSIVPVASPRRRRVGSLMVCWRWQRYWVPRVASGLAQVCRGPSISGPFVTPRGSRVQVPPEMVRSPLLALSWWTDRSWSSGLAGPRPLGSRVLTPPCPRFGCVGRFVWFRLGCVVRFVGLGVAREHLLRLPLSLAGGAPRGLGRVSECVRNRFYFV